MYIHFAKDKIILVNIINIDTCSHWFFSFGGEGVKTKSRALHSEYFPGRL